MIPTCMVAVIILAIYAAGWLVGYHEGRERVR